jgi:Uma2 family endonuclease
MATVEATPVVGEQRMLLTDLTWDFYKRFCDELGERPIRLTFSDGCLEIMITKSRHEYYKKLLAKLVENIVLEMNIPVRSGGSMTFQRDDLQKGFEHDECWWIAREREVRGKDEFDFHEDPPPDLAIEVEISSGVMNRMKVFAALRVPEVWRFDGNKLRFCVLQPDGTYGDQPASLSFPFLKPEHLRPFLSLTDEVDETTRIRSFIEWFRKGQF